jgi:2-(1,2-epoxy-1,2-dihydrophenyl)acetyl-CoA isomerase
LLLEGWAHSYPEQLAAEREAIVDCARTQDAREGLAAFADRRAPGFTGR